MINQINNKDYKLVDRFLKTRDEQTFEEIYDRYTPILYILALRLVGGSEADAQDVIQEMWIRGCRKLPEFQWKSTLKTWLSGILINCVRELSRKGSKLKEELPETLPLKVVKNPSQHFELEKIIRSLPTGYRHVLILHDAQGYTHEEIAGFLGISAGTSKSQLFHARRSVRASYQSKQEKCNE